MYIKCNKPDFEFFFLSIGLKYIFICNIFFFIRVKISYFILVDQIKIKLLLCVSEKRISRVSVPGFRAVGWTRWLALAVPRVFALKHCRTSVSVRGWWMVRTLFELVLPKVSFLMNVFVELARTFPNRRHSSLGEGFPWASQTHVITLLWLQELEILGATERENVIINCSFCVESEQNKTAWGPFSSH